MAAMDNTEESWRLFPMDAETEAYCRVRGVDPRVLEMTVTSTLSRLHYVLPKPPSFSSSPGADISAPLVLADAALLPATTTAKPRKRLEVTPAESQAVACAVTGILEAHQGPIRSAHLVSCCMSKFPPGLLARWIHLLAIKGVMELVLVNRPWPIDVDLPPGFFAMATLSRLYLGVFRFPDTALLMRGIQFPNLRELGLLCVSMENKDMDFVLARSPVLETLCIQANILLSRLSIVSGSLRCAQIIEATNLDVVVEDAKRLERLIIWSTSVRDGSPRRVKIGCAQALSIVGCLEPALHRLQIGNTVIEPGTRASLSTIVPSVKILALRVCFGLHSDAKMLPSFLRCFPNVKRLHIESEHEIGEATCKCKFNNKFWQEGGAIECVHSHIEMMIFYGFRGAPKELLFLGYILESARMLKNLVIVFSNATSKTKANKKLKPLFAGKWANKDCSLVPVESAVKEGEARVLLKFERGSDFSTKDPFVWHPAFGLELSGLLDLEEI